MISAELLQQIDSRLKQITGNFNKNFGGVHIFFVRDLRQLPPVRATPIYKQIKQQLDDRVLWRDLQFFALNQVMRQADRLFSGLLTKLGNGEQLDDDELKLVESRLFTREQANELCPNGFRLFLKNESVDAYNNSVLNVSENNVTSTSNDIYTGCQSAVQEASMRQKLHKMSLIDTGGLPYQIIFVMQKSYMITTNIDVSDGLVNGALGNLVHIDMKLLEFGWNFQNPEE